MPFVTTRRPTTLEQQLVRLALFGLALTTSFEFHFVELVRDVSRSSDLPNGPEREKLRRVRTGCVYGNDEPSFGCRDTPETLITEDGLSRRHHFDQHPEALVAHAPELPARPKR